MANTAGAAWVPGLALPMSTAVISKGCALDMEACSAFQDADLASRLTAPG